MKDMTIVNESEMHFNLADFEIDAFGRYEVTDPEMLDIVAARRLCGPRDTALRSLHIAGRAEVERAHIDTNGCGRVGRLHRHRRPSEASGDQRGDQSVFHGRNPFIDRRREGRAGSTKAQVTTIGASVAPRSEYG